VNSFISFSAADAMEVMSGLGKYPHFENAHAVLDRFCGFASDRVRLACCARASRRGWLTTCILAKAHAKFATDCEPKSEMLGSAAAEIACNRGTSKLNAAKDHAILASAYPLNSAQLDSTATIIEVKRGST